jgi:hypothetical protein
VPPSNPPIPPLNILGSAWLVAAYVNPPNIPAPTAPPANVDIPAPINAGIGNPRSIYTTRQYEFLEQLTVFGPVHK